MRPGSSLPDCKCQQVPASATGMPGPSGHHRPALPPAKQEAYRVGKSGARSRVRLYFGPLLPPCLSAAAMAGTVALCLHAHALPDACSTVSHSQPQPRASASVRYSWIAAGTPPARCMLMISTECDAYGRDSQLLNKCAEPGPPQLRRDGGPSVAPRSTRRPWHFNFQEVGQREHHVRMRMHH